MFKLKILWLGLLLIAQQAEALQVVTTIKPIHALVSGVMDGVGTPYLLLHGGESPHTYNLLPSQVKRLHRATVVIWVGPTAESFLKKTLTTLSAHIVRLIDAPGLNLLKVREGKAWETHHHEEDHDEEDHHEEDHEFEINSHIWLDPDNAKVIVQTIAHTLSEIDANNAARYTANATRLLERIDLVDQIFRKYLAPVKTVPFLVFHDAYQYFEHHYGLTAVGAITLSPESPPGAKRLAQLRARLKTQQVRCVFSEPQFESALVTTLIEGTTVRRGVLDPLGVDLAAKTDSYFVLLGHLTFSLRQCLSQ